MEFSDDDLPVGQRLRVMHVLQVQPGRAKDPDNGPPIAIVHLEHKDEVEQPLMFEMRDVRRLAIGMLAVVAEYEGGLAEEIVRQHFLKSDGTACFAALDPKNLHVDAQSTPVPEKPKPLRIPPLFTIKMSFSDSSIKPVQLGVTSGFRCGRTTLLVCCCDDLGQSITSLACLGPHKTISMLTGIPDDLMAAAVNVVTTSIVFDGQNFRRLRHEELKRAVLPQIFKFRPNLPRKGEKMGKLPRRNRR